MNAQQNAIMIGIAHLFCALLLAALSLPLIQGQIEPNRFYGIRFSKSYSSREAWYAINRYGGKCMVGWSVVIALLAIVNMVLQPAPGSGLFWLFLLSPLVVVLGLLQCWWYAERHF